MNLPGKDTTPTQWIMWAAGVLLLTVVGLISPISVTWKDSGKENEAIAKIFIERLDLMAKTQGTMQKEHQDLLRAAMIQCYNHAENVQERERRDRQIRRCITKQLYPD